LASGTRGDDPDGPRPHPGQEPTQPLRDGLGPGTCRDEPQRRNPGNLREHLREPPAWEESGACGDQSRVRQMRSGDDFPVQVQALVQVISAKVRLAQMGQVVSLPGQSNEDGHGVRNDTVNIESKFLGRNQAGEFPILITWARCFPCGHAVHHTNRFSSGWVPLVRNRFETAGVRFGTSNSIP